MLFRNPVLPDRLSRAASGELPLVHGTYPFPNGRPVAGFPSAIVKSPKQTIGFRLEEEYRSALVAHAKDLDLTVSELVSRYVTAGLREDAARGSVYDALCSMKAELKESRRDLSLLAETLLVATGNVGEEEARAWATKNLAAE